MHDCTLTGLAVSYFIFLLVLEAMCPYQLIFFFFETYCYFWPTGKCLTITSHPLPQGGKKIPAVILTAHSTLPFRGDPQQAAKAYYIIQLKKIGLTTQTMITITGSTSVFTNPNKSIYAPSL